MRRPQGIADPDSQRAPGQGQQWPGRAQRPELVQTGPDSSMCFCVLITVLACFLYSFVKKGHTSFMELCKAWRCGYLCRAGHLASQYQENVESDSHQGLKP